MQGTLEAPKPAPAPVTEYPILSQLQEPGPSLENKNILDSQIDCGVYESEETENGDRQWPWIVRIHKNSIHEKYIVLG